MRRETLGRSALTMMMWGRRVSKGMRRRGCQGDLISIEYCRGPPEYQACILTTVIYIYRAPLLQKWHKFCPFFRPIEVQDSINICHQHTICNKQTNKGSGRTTYIYIVYYTGFTDLQRVCRSYMLPEEATLDPTSLNIEKWKGLFRPHGRGNDGGCSQKEWCSQPPEHSTASSLPCNPHLYPQNQRPSSPPPSPQPHSTISHALSSYFCKMIFHGQPHQTLLYLREVSCCIESKL